MSKLDPTSPDARQLYELYDTLSDLIAIGESMAIMIEEGQGRGLTYEQAVTINEKMFNTVIKGIALFSGKTPKEIETQIAADVEFCRAQNNDDTTGH